MGLMKNKLDGRIISEFYKPERYAVLRSQRWWPCWQESNGHDYKITMETTLSEKNKAIVRWWQKFGSEFHNIFAWKVNKITLSANDDNRLQILDQAISYPYSISLGRVSTAELMRRRKTKIPGENPQEHNPNWPQIPDHPNRILIIAGSKSGKTNANKLSLTKWV